MDGIIQGQDFLPRSQLCKPWGLLLESKDKSVRFAPSWTNIITFTPYGRGGGGRSHLEAPKVLEGDAPLVSTLVIRTPRGACCEDHHLSPLVSIFKSNNSKHLMFAWAHPPSCLPQPPAQVMLRQR